MYPFGHLPGNLAVFCRTLRHEYGFRLGPGELRDAARALEVVDLASGRRVKDALRVTLAGSRDDAEAFDLAFDRFFFPGPSGVAQPHQPPMGRRGERRADGPAAGERHLRPGDAAGDGGSAEGDVGSAQPTAVESDQAATESREARLMRARYSPLEADGRTTVEVPPVDTPWRDAARLFVRRVQLGLSRRWRPGATGSRFDLRRTWRASLQTGGEALSPRWLRRPRRAPRFVMLIDGSRSMSGVERPALALAAALASATSRMEAFVFSTALWRVTHEVRQAGAGRAAAFGVGRDAWGGGTNIGASLHAFLQRHGERLLGRDTLVFVVSDGVDVGDPAALASAMRELQRRSAGVVWLNPLVGTPGYQPTSRGMAAARPFIATFTNVPDAEALRGLTRLMSTRRR